MEAGAGGGMNTHTLFLETRRGWRGILIEPNPDLFRNLTKKGRQALINNQITLKKTHLPIFYILPSIGDPSKFLFVPYFESGRVPIPNEERILSDCGQELYFNDFSGSVHNLSAILQHLPGAGISHH